MSTFGCHGCAEFITSVVSSGLEPRERLVSSFLVEVLSTHCLLAPGALNPHLWSRDSSACGRNSRVAGLKTTSSSTNLECPVRASALSVVRLHGYTSTVSGTLPAEVGYRFGAGTFLSDDHPLAREVFGACSTCVCSILCELWRCRASAHTSIQGGACWVIHSSSSLGCTH